MGIDPYHFGGAAGSNVHPIVSTCGDIYPQYSWQVPDDLVSREEIAMAIFNAEQDLKRTLGYSPALAWETGEPYYYGGNRQYAMPPYKLRFGHLRSGGRRAVTRIGTYPLTWLDTNGDGFNETAAFTMAIATCSDDGVPIPQRELKVYFEGKGGAQEWEIRSPRASVNNGGFITTYLDAYLLFDPILTHAPTSNAGFNAIDLENPASYVTRVDVYREWADTSTAIETNQPGCEWDVTTGCMKIGNRELGMVMPSMSDGGACFTSYEPMDVRNWYWAGDVSDEYERNETNDPLSEYWAQTITWMATARLEKNVCSCSNVREVADGLRRNVAASSSNGGNAYNAIETIANPFGTRVGEVRAWGRAMNMANGQLMMSGAF